MTNLIVNLEYFIKDKHFNKAIGYLIFKLIVVIAFVVSVHLLDTAITSSFATKHCLNFITALN